MRELRPAAIEHVDRVLFDHGFVGLAVGVGLLALIFQGNWWLVLATALIAIALPAVGQLVQPEAFLDPVKGAPAAPDRPAAPVAVEVVVESVADARP